ncbi:glycosyltransferase [Microbacterium sp. NPDC076911]|uniref:glycosyltransferase n=1 Tax=Microbacterium sp. NPDC076911 TaxID=3154958 RepID=UPI00341F6B93
MSVLPLAAVVVVVPVHNEEALLARCLQSLHTAIRQIDLPCEVRVVLDACTDRSAQIASRFPFEVIEVATNAVGAARAIGVAAALADFDDIDAERIWIAATDADSQLPPQWLTAQRALADIGNDVVVGTVRPDFADLSRRHRSLWLQTHIPGKPNGHVHGANLGVRASTYLVAGGFRAVAEHEDVGLVAQCRAVGGVVVASDAAEVLTSGRFEGRTPGGYAGYLRNQAAELRSAHAALDDQCTA